MDKVLNENDIRMIEGNLNRISLCAQQIANDLTRGKDDPLIRETLDRVEYIRDRIKK